MKKLSIITINKNNASGLETTIRSVVGQTWTDYDYIVIDGNSDDSSVEIIKKYEDAISYWISEPDTGIYNAMNKGIRKATGEYCLFLNSGDYLYKNNILELIFSEIYDEAILYGDLLIKNDRGIRVQKFPSQLTFLWLYNEYLGHPSTLIKRDLFIKIGFYNESNRIVSDWEFLLLALAKFNNPSRYLAFPISVIMEGGISNNLNYRSLVLKERSDVLNNHFPLFIEDYELLNSYKNKRMTRTIKRSLKKLFKSKL